jgi:hypothetical protein
MVAYRVVFRGLSGLYQGGVSGSLSGVNPTHPLEAAAMSARDVVGPRAGRCVAKAAGDLQDTLGPRLTAYAVGLRDPGEIDSYARALAHPRSETADRLCDLHSITQRLAAGKPPGAAREWMVCSSPLLDDRAPLEVLHEQSRAPTRALGVPGRAVDGFRRVEHAANAYLDAA